MLLNSEILFTLKMAYTYMLSKVRKREKQIIEKKVEEKMKKSKKERKKTRKKKKKGEKRGKRGIEIKSIYHKIRISILCSHWKKEKRKGKREKKLILVTLRKAARNESGKMVSEASGRLTLRSSAVI